MTVNSEVKCLASSHSSKALSLKLTQLCAIAAAFHHAEPTCLVVGFSGVGVKQEGSGPLPNWPKIVTVGSQIVTVECPSTQIVTK